jgi:hypothetical protein
MATGSKVQGFSVQRLDNSRQMSDDRGQFAENSEKIATDSGLEVGAGPYILDLIDNRMAASCGCQKPAVRGQNP